MEKLEYRIEIAAPAKKVWETMLQKDTYEQWVALSWPTSSYEGKWEKDALIKFIGDSGSGTLAEIVDIKPYERVLARHVAVLGEGGVEDRTSDVANGWVGTTEGYTFDEHAGRTTVRVVIETGKDWKQMFDEGWPTALQELKRIAEGA